MLLCVFALLISVTDKRYHILPSRDSIDGTIFPCHTCETRTTFIVFYLIFGKQVYLRRCEKPPLTKPQTALRKQKTRSVERGYFVPLPKF